VSTRHGTTISVPALSAGHRRTRTSTCPLLPSWSARCVSVDNLRRSFIRFVLLLPRGQSVWFTQRHYSLLCHYLIVFGITLRHCSSNRGAIGLPITWTTHHYAETNRSLHGCDWLSLHVYALWDDGSQSSISTNLCVKYSESKNSHCNPLGSMTRAYN